MTRPFIVVGKADGGRHLKLMQSKQPEHIIAGAPLFLEEPRLILRKQPGVSTSLGSRDT